MPAEQALGQRFEVDVELGLDLRPAAQHDDLARTINYAEVYDTVKRLVEGERFALLEALAEAIAVQVGRRFAPQRVRVCVRKPHAPIAGILDHVAVEIERTPEAWQ
ncbi:MAG: dihydroneopterin aldolase [Candidatus Tectimicrobiota bacterium]|nr:MAG: dihydroneopterin aldolase [Candidatus Tectomicrobia bacterium]